MNGSDLHTHTVFSDGLNTMEEMVRVAEAKGFASIGFSDHSFTGFDLRCCIREEQLPQYHAEIRRLKTEYAGRIGVYAGLEHMTVSRRFIMNKTLLYQLTETSKFMMSFVIVTQQDNVIVVDGGRPEDMPLLKEYRSTFFSPTTRA